MTETDKMVHLLAGSLLVLIIYPFNKPISILLLIGFVIGKEIVDLVTGLSIAERMDIYYTLAGGI